MIGSTFRQAVKEATGLSWEQWVTQLQQTVDSLWSHERIKEHIGGYYGVPEEWAEWLAAMYGEVLGRIPVGVTKDAGVQIGVRRTMEMTKEQAWHFLTSPQGMKLWIGTVSAMQWQKGYEFVSEEGVSGKLTVVVPLQKLRMTWKRPEWDKASRLQIYLLSTSSGKTTIALHQEMLEDVYMRDVMKRHWEQALVHVKNHAEAVQ
ncbi:hypothetical protein PAESOLCIP111_06275 [Paenibacillus solanacearum]|uniref:Activator of Hsp90 ATPase homologue 1/2-like C-terminal domain-containing protein n=1 Tax=Paenibacillus solanacearum TaxID=2048548 RepID=A0A916NYW1_9BACL|nr:SRPBCC domain-containing protein [Paenibacillus solanacearum]CAG7651249.1 hypothetical protein PAESOLCIP111_06275 [Paenibacillus solanacearum]